jgi:hypothetical protein
MKTKSEQEMKDWWIDTLIQNNIPMLENKVDGQLTEACEYAKARGARLVTRADYLQWLSERANDENHHPISQD